MPSRRTPVTVGEVADRAGLSRQTVSNILNNKGHLFKRETCQLVLRVAEELGYRPNSIAKALRSGRFNGIGLVSSANQGFGTVMPTVLEGIHEVLRERDLHLVSGRYTDEMLVDKTIAPKILRELMADGMMINYTHQVPPGMVELLAGSALPYVWLNSLNATDAVRPNDFQGGKDAAEFLLSLGHKRIAFVNLVHSETEIRGRGRALHYSTLHRVTGYEQAMKTAGLTPRLIARREELTEEQSMRGYFDWLEGPDRPTALIFYGDAGIVPVLMRAVELGLKIGRDLSIMVFMDGELDIGGMAVDQVIVPHRKVGAAAVRALLKKIEAPNQISLPSVVIPCEIRPQFVTVGPCLEHSR